MKKFKQLKKFGSEVQYIKPASVKEHTITNSAYDVVLRADKYRPREILDWCETANVDAIMLGTVFIVDTACLPRDLMPYQSCYVIRIRNTVSRAMFTMQFNTTPAQSGCPITAIFAD